VAGFFQVMLNGQPSATADEATIKQFCFVTLAKVFIFGT
jgi:hypothetical protein